MRGEKIVNKAVPLSCCDPLVDVLLVSDLGGLPMLSAGLWLGGKTTIGCS
jgi:hypothetical protein